MNKIYLLILLILIYPSTSFGEVDELEQLINSLTQEQDFPVSEPEVKNEIPDETFTNDLAPSKDEKDMVLHGNYYRKLSIRGLDKITAKVTLLTMPVGVVVKYGDLEITARLCWKAPKDSDQENKAFIEIYERKADNTRKPVFIGWMFSSSPSISSMEHPIYDIMLVECLGEPS